MRHLSPEFVLSVKDQLRKLRYTIRNEANAVPTGAIEFVGDVAGRPHRILEGNLVAKITDEMLSFTETVARSLIAPEGNAGLTFPKPIYAFLGEDCGVTSDFTHDCYDFVKYVLQHAGARNALVLEHLIETGRRQLLARHGDLLRRDFGDPAFNRPEFAADAAAACAAIVVHLTAVRPILKLELSGTPQAPRHFLLSPNIFCFAVIGLATLVLSLRTEALDPAEVIESAMAAVDARFSRIAGALKTSEPVQALAQEFELIAPHLP